VRVKDHRDEEISLIGVPLKMSATPGVVGTAPPPLGRDTRAVLMDQLGLSAERIDELYRDGVL